MKKARTGRLRSDYFAGRGPQCWWITTPVVFLSVFNSLVVFWGSGRTRSCILVAKSLLSVIDVSSPGHCTTMAYGYGTDYSTIRGTVSGLSARSLENDHLYSDITPRI
jgi:hypothetical protein